MDGGPINFSECLVISLGDFATDGISNGHESVSLSVPFDRLFELLDKAEKIQQAREADDGRQKIKSSRRPVDELRAEDEMHFLSKERIAVEQSKAADKILRHEYQRGEPSRGFCAGSQWANIFPDTNHRHSPVIHLFLPTAAT